MGIPKFFKYIVDRYPVIKSHIENAVDNLYFDLNSLIHPCCRESHANYPFNEGKMIELIIERMDYIIDYVKPTKMVFIAIDGVAPFAKIIQQRDRRYKSIQTEQFKKQTYADYNKAVITTDKKEYRAGWDTNAISPGTEFMRKLSTGIYNHFESLKKIPKNRGIQYILSDTEVEQEGEQKIVQYIRHYHSALRHKTHVIYGLDADLIILGLSLQMHKVYLIREQPEFAKKMNDNPYLYLSIGSLAHYIAVALNDTISTYHRGNLVNDFIFISFLLGNDFLPHIFGINIKTNGVDMLLDIYKRVLTATKEHLIVFDPKDGVKINPAPFMMFIRELRDREDSLKESYIAEHLKFSPRIPGAIRCPLERKMKESEFVTDIKDHWGLAGNKDWVNVFCKNVFGDTSKEEGTQYGVKEYLYGLRWNLKYYFEGSVDWEWYYPFEYAPPMSVLHDFMMKNVGYMNSRRIPMNQPLSSIEQMICIFPTESHHLIPKEVVDMIMRRDSMIRSWYPTEYHIHTEYKEMLWECKPELPPMHIGMLRKNEELQSYITRYRKGNVGKVKFV